MNDMPERIWADGDLGMVSTGRWVTQGDENPFGRVEYIRADLVEALTAERDALQAKLDAITTAPDETERLANAAKTILANRWQGYSNHKALTAMFAHVHDMHGRHMLPVSHYDGVFQAGLKVIAALSTQEGGE